MQDNTIAALDPKNPQADTATMTIPFVGDAAATPKVAQVVGPYITYHQGSMSDANDMVESGRQVNKSLIKNVNTAKDISNTILDGAIQEHTQAMVNQLSSQGWSGMMNSIQQRLSGKK